MSGFLKGMLLSATVREVFTMPTMLKGPIRLVMSEAVMTRILPWKLLGKSG